MSLSFPVLPMKASMGALPAVDEGWAYEIKWDGYRTLVFVDGDAVRLQSSSGRDVTDRWPEFASLAQSVHAGSVVLDAELVVFDDDGRPSFELVQQSGVGSRRQAVLHVFDVLAVDGTDVVAIPYLDRRRLLDSLLEPTENWLIPAHRIGDGDTLLAATAEQGLEGVIAKRIDSTYRPGTRSKDWIKIKNRTTVDLVIGGYTEGSGTRSSTFGALLLGRADAAGPDVALPEDAGGGGAGRLAFAGGVGTGFDQATLEELTSRLRAIETDSCPFSPPPPARHRRGARWVRPELIATVEIAEFTNDGLVRHASFRHLTPATDPDHGDRDRTRLSS